MHGTLWLDSIHVDGVQIFFIEVPYG